MKGVTVAVRWQSNSHILVTDLDLIRLAVCPGDRTLKILRHEHCVLITAQKVTECQFCEHFVPSTNTEAPQVKCRQRDKCSTITAGNRRALDELLFRGLRELERYRLCASPLFARVGT